MKKWLAIAVVTLVLSSFFISLAVEEKKGKVSPMKEVTIDQKLNKIMKQNESIIRQLKHIEGDLEFMRKELRIIKARA